jgi:hypothetical protein
VSTAPGTPGPAARGGAGGRIQLLDNTWLLTLVAVVLATALPRLLGAFEADAGAIAWGVLGLGAIHVALAAAAERKRSRGVWLPRGLLAVHAAGVVLLGVVWQFAGGLQNPAFLLVFVFPVIGATFLSRRQPYLSAALAILVVSALALRHTPELRWYVAGIGPAAAWLTALLGDGGSAAGAPFPGFYAPSGYFVVTLVAFVVLLGACAVSAEFLAAFFTRLRERAGAARREVMLAEELWLKVIQHLPAPALLIDAGTREVVCVSRLWAERFQVRGTPSSTALLFRALKFSYPELLEELIAGADGTTRPCMVRVAGRLRATEIRVQHLSHADRQLALVIMEDVTESLCMSAALDAAEYATVVIDAKECVIGFNKPARGLWAEIEVGGDATPLLARLGLGKGAWLPGLGGRRKSHVEIRGRVCEVRTSAIALPGEADCVYLLAVAPTALASAETLLTGAQALVP